jgi:hypothetical protein
VTYSDFLRSKATVATVDGFHVELDTINPVLKEHQRLLIQWAVAGGRRAMEGR